MEDGFDELSFTSMSFHPTLKQSMSVDNLNQLNNFSKFTTYGRKNDKKSFITLPDIKN